jgi:2-polyprenyl-3-methyl-5-hydroxy-6-metoxy-1,4-benzoquinol methylase
MPRCTICNKTETSLYMTTHALMHKKNDEQYRFNLCKNCETVFLTNRVSEETLETYYTDNYLPYKGSAAWGKFSNFVENSQKHLDLRRVNVLKKWIGDTEKQITLLDVGCGNPTFLEAAIKNINVSCTGIDFSDSGWKNKMIKNISLINTSIETFTSSQKFDIITLWHYLEHDYHPKQTIEKLYEFLAPGGKLIIEVPDYKSITAKQQGKYWQGWHSPRHLSLFSSKSFEVLFDAQRWKIAKHYRYGTLDAFTLWWLGKMEKKGIDWSSSMEKEFWPLVFLKVITLPLFLFEKILPFGIQLIVIEKK